MTAVERLQAWYAEGDGNVEFSHAGGNWTVRATADAGARIGVEAKSAAFPALEDAAASIVMLLEEAGVEIPGGPA